MENLIKISSLIKNSENSDLRRLAALISEILNAKSDIATKYSDPVGVTLYRAMPKFGRWSFRVKGNKRGSNPEGYIVKVKFASRGNIKDVKKLQVKVHCECLTGDTKIKLLDGRDLSMEELVNEFGYDKEYYVYSVDENGDFHPGKAKNLGITKHSNKIYEIELDSGEKVKCSENHLFMLRNGKYKIAKELSVNDSMMPMYFERKSVRGTKLKYLYVKMNSKKNQWKIVHRVVANEINKTNKDFKISELIETNKDKFLIVHHKNFDSYNNSPNNLLWLGNKEHSEYHSKYFKELNAKKWADPEMRKIISQQKAKAGKICIEKHPELSKKRTIAGIKWTRNNHEVLSKQMSETWDRNGEAIRKKLKIFYNTPESKKNASQQFKNAWTHERKEKLIERIKKIDHCGEKNPMKRKGMKFYTLLSKVICFLFRQPIEFLEKDNIVKIWKKGLPRLDLFLQQISYEKLIEFLNYAKEISFDGKYRKFGKYRDLVMNYCIQKETFNHKIKNIRIIETKNMTPLYDICVEKYHNFVLGSGIVSHNCNAFQFYGPAYNLTSIDSALEKENRPPDIRDPEGQNFMCKHVYKTLEFLNNRNYQIG